MGKVNGKDVLVSIYDAGLNEYVTIACARSIQFDETRDLIETSITGAGSWRTFTPGAKSFSGSIEGLVFIQKEVTDKFHLGAIYDLFDSGAQAEIKIYETDEDGVNFLQKGFFCFIESINESSSFDNINTFSLTFKGTGAPAITYGEV